MGQWEKEKLKKTKQPKEEGVPILRP